MTRALKIRFLKYSHAQHTVKYNTTHTNTNHQHYRTNKTLRQPFVHVLVQHFSVPIEKKKNLISQNAFTDGNCISNALLSQ